MVKPGGTGSPSCAISARPAPLPPSRLRIDALPSARPSPKLKTHLPLAGADAFGFETDLAATLSRDFGRDFRTFCFLAFARGRWVFRLAIAQLGQANAAGKTVLKSTAQVPCASPDSV